MNNNLFSSSATAEEIINSINNIQEQLILEEYQVLIGTAEAINKIKESDIDLLKIVFIENNYCKGGMLLIQDTYLKKSILIQKGILK